MPLKKHLFSCFVEQKALHFHFALSPTNHVSGPAWNDIPTETWGCCLKGGKLQSSVFHAGDTACVKAQR